MVLMDPRLKGKIIGQQGGREKPGELRRLTTLCRLPVPSPVPQALEQPGRQEPRAEPHWGKAERTLCMYSIQVDLRMDSGGPAAARHLDPIRGRGGRYHIVFASPSGDRPSTGASSRGALARGPNKTKHVGGAPPSPWGPAGAGRAAGLLTRGKRQHPVQGCSPVPSRPLTFGAPAWPVVHLRGKNVHSG